MASPNPPMHLRLTWTGELGTADPVPETFSFGLSSNVPIPDGEGVITPAALSALATACSSAFTSLAPQVALYATLTRARAALVGSDGRVMTATDGSYRQADDLTRRVATGSGAGMKPFQVAAVVSLRTALPTANGRGRFYVPLPIAVIDGATGLVSAASATALRTAAVAFIANVQVGLSAVGAGFVVSVASGGSTLYGVAPANIPVTAVGVGRALDTIRSRRTSLVESTEFVAVP